MVRGLEYKNRFSNLECFDHFIQNLPNAPFYAKLFIFEPKIECENLLLGNPENYLNTPARPMI